MQGMIKLFSPGDWQDANVDDNQIKIASGGLGIGDKLAAKKFASDELLHWLERLDTHPDCVYVHKLAMSGSNRYGPNRWGDGFRDEVLQRDVPTFEIYAKAYRHHKSANSPHYGKPKIARFRKDLGTVELATEYYGTDKIAAERGGNLADLEIQSLTKRGYIPVSMGSHVPGDRCFPAGSLVLTDRGLVPIEEIRISDLVLTHCGRFRAVRRLGQRIHRGCMVDVKPTNHLGPLRTSDEHPYYVLKRDVVRMPAGRRRADLSRVTPVWVEAKNVHVGDFVLSPVYECEATDTIAMARLFGYYAGNGSRIIQRTGRKKDGPHRLMGFTISGNALQPEIREEVRNTIESLAINTPTSKEDPEKSAYDLRTYDQLLANRLVSECGDLCENKRAPSYLYAASAQERLAFLGGLIDTDGSVDRATGLIRIPLSNTRLVLDAYLLGLGVGIRGSVSSGESTGFGGEGVSEVTTLSIAASHYDLLSPYSWKVKNWGKACKPGGNAFAYSYDGRQYVAIEVESTVTEAAEEVVYNLSVTEDESYTVDGVAVHNCVICNHWAKTRAQHCLPKTAGGTCDLFGCRHGILKIASDGRQQYVDNPLNCFFDISYVAQGADPIANGVLLPLGMFDSSKVAEYSDKLAAYTPAEIVQTSDILCPTRRAAIQLAYLWADLESKLANSPIDETAAGLAATTDPTGLSWLFASSPSIRSAAIAKLASLGVFPSFKAYAKAAGYSDGEIKYAAEFVPDLYTRLVRRGLVGSVAKSINLEKFASDNFVEVKTSGNDNSIARDAAIRRGLRCNAEGVVTNHAKVASLTREIPDVVVEYGACKLAWACRADLDPWIVHALAKREFFTNGESDL